MFNLTSDWTVHALSEQELAKVLVECRRYGLPQHWSKWAAVFSLLAEYGPRVSELFWLKKADVDLEKHTVALTTLKRWKLLDDGNGHRYNVRVHRKRVLPLRPWLLELLRVYLQTAPPGPMMFRCASMEAWRVRVWRVWRKCSVRAGIAHRRVHDLRHTVGTRLAERDLLLARDVLDHLSLETTSKYVRCRDLSKKFLAVPGAKVEAIA